MGNTQTRSMGNVSVDRVASTSLASPETASHYVVPRRQSQVPTVRLELNHSRNIKSSKSSPIHVEFPSQSSSNHTNGVLLHATKSSDIPPKLNRSASTPTFNEVDDSKISHSSHPMNAVNNSNHSHHSKMSNPMKKPGLQSIGSEPQQRLITPSTHHCHRNVPSKVKKKKPSLVICFE